MKRPRLTYGNSTSAIVPFIGRPINAMQRTLVNSAMNRLRNRKRTRSGAARSYTQTVRKKATNYGGILGGTEADKKFIYRRRRMPRRKRRRWRRFVKKVQAVSEKSLGTRTVLINDQLTQRNTTLPQSSITLCLYPGRSTDAWLNDVRAISGLENIADQTAALGNTIYNSTKFLFQSAVMDLTFRNTSTFKIVDPANPAQTIDQLDGRAAIELDVYEFIHTKPASDGLATQPNISQMLEFSDDAEIGGTGNDISIYNRGATPFEFGKQMAYYGLKIVKKTKYFVPNGQTITHQIRDPSRHVWTRETMDRFDGTAIPGVTRSLFFLYKLVPGLPLGNIVSTFALAAEIGLTRKYAYKIEGISESRHRLLGTAVSVAVNS